jgi:hypothetical protein
MSNLAGKAFAMNLITPHKPWWVPIKKFLFWALRPSNFINGFLQRIGAGKFAPIGILGGLITLSMIHYARWVIVRPNEWPHLGDDQPRENLNYPYQLFFSNFNGTWAQYVDSFSAAIPKGLNLLWKWNVGWPQSVPQEPFHRYVEHNEIWTDYYYSAYPMAASNDIKAAQRLRRELLEFIEHTNGLDAKEFQLQYDKLLNSLQGNPSRDALKPENFPCLGQIGPSPIVSLALLAINPQYRNIYQSDTEAQHAK